MWMSTSAPRSSTRRLYISVFVFDLCLTCLQQVRDGQIAQYNLILVVGEKEAANNLVNVRLRDASSSQEAQENDLVGEKSIDQLLVALADLTKSKSNKY